MTPETLDADRAAAQRKILNRLKRARGQLDGVIRAVEEGRHCRDVITQLSAVNSALQKAGFAVISSAMRDCVSEEPTNPQDLETQFKELEKLFLSLS